VGRYKFLALRTAYWRPRKEYIESIVKAVRGKVKDGCFVTVSEKAVSTALCNILNENDVEPSWTARVIAKYWMRLIWGYILGLLCHLREATIEHLREYPIERGSRHKQVALERAGFFQALMPSSEGGIDGSNLPYSYVSLPLENPNKIANQIQKHIKISLGKNVVVAIVDTDKTYSFKSFHFTPHPKPLKGIHSYGGLFAYVIGRLLKLKRRATPIAVTSSQISVEEILEISKIANRARGSGAGRSIWEMAKTFHVPLDGVTWEMLEHVRHTPIVIVKTVSSRDYLQNNLT
jgi:F420-0:gamma-glutamyl ligase-like protein